jgi:hypothetical protein
VICCVPQFVAQRFLPENFQRPVMAATYSPWIVANLSVENWDPGPGRPLSWDNVIYGSDSLGYVNAGHQLLRIDDHKTVLTFYMPLTDREPAEARKFLRGLSHEELAEIVLAELRKAHPDAEAYITRIDIRTWGHAMIRPVRNYIWGNERAQLSASVGDKIFFAHSDLSGISIFEEAFYQGIRAATKILQA